MVKRTNLLIPVERIERAILLIRGEKVLLDRDLAELYGVETRVLVQAVKRNLRRFPADFMFQLSKDEFENWRSQFVMSNPGSKMGLRRRPYAFTEQGVAMLSSVLNSDRAIEVNIAIMRAFVRLRDMLATHVLGVRAFGTQLLCEQVVGRGLRRMSYHAESSTLALPDGTVASFESFPVEYAEVYGVPFSFIPSAGSSVDPKPGPIPTRVRALESRIGCEITFPRIDGYRYELPGERLTAKFTKRRKIGGTWSAFFCHQFFCPMTA